MSSQLPVPVTQDPIPAPSADLEGSMTAEDALEVYSLRLQAIRGKRPASRLLKRKLSPDQIRLWHELAMFSALMLQDRLMHLARHGQQQACLACLGTGRMKDGQTDCLVCRGRGRVKTEADPRIVKLALDSVLDVKDRVMGKPTEHVQVAQAVQVIVGGIDLNRLPGGHPEPVPVQEEPDRTEGQ